MQRLHVVWDGSEEWDCLPVHIKERQQKMARRKTGPGIHFEEVASVPLTDVERDALAVAMWTKSTPNPVLMTEVLEVGEWERGGAVMLTYLGKFSIKAALAGDSATVAKELEITEEQTESLITSWSVSGSDSVDMMYRHYQDEAREKAGE